MFTFALSKDGLHTSLPYLTVLSLPQRDPLPVRFMTFSTPDVIVSQKLSEAASSPVYCHFCTSDLKHFRRCI